MVGDFFFFSFLFYSEEWVDDWLMLVYLDIVFELILFFELVLVWDIFFFCLYIWFESIDEISVDWLVVLVFFVLVYMDEMIEFLGCWCGEF